MDQAEDQSGDRQGGCEAPLFVQPAEEDTPKDHFFANCYNEEHGKSVGKDLPVATGTLHLIEAK